MSEINEKKATVIGSSPLMLLQAMYLVRDGYKVSLFERCADYGGTWQTVKTKKGSEVEIGSHLIEFFPKVYELLEEESEIPFIALNEQPIRIHPTGLKFSYFNQVMMLLGGLRLFLGFIRLKVGSLLLRSGDENDLVNYRTKLTWFFKHQLPVIFSTPTVKGPKSGYVDFINKLADKTVSMGVEFIYEDIVRLEKDKEGWKLVTTDGKQFYADEVHTSSSANFIKTGTGTYQAGIFTKLEREAIIIKVPKKHIYKNQSYVAFWRDKQIFRISRLDTEEAGAKDTRFLLELKLRQDQSSTELNDLIRKKFQKAEIIKKDGVFSIEEEIKCVFSRNIDQMPNGMIDENLFAYYSNGNLAAGVAEWLKLQTSNN